MEKKEERIKRILKILRKLKVSPDKLQNYYTRGDFDISTGRKFMNKMKEDGLIEIRKEGHFRYPYLTKLGFEKEQCFSGGLNVI